MIKATTAELKALGVPFFGTETIAQLKLGGDGLAIMDGANDQRLGEAELVRLQAKMLELLEDLCKE